MNDIQKESLFLFSVVLFTCVAGVLSTFYTWRNQTMNVLIVDVFHSFLPDLSDWFSIPNIIFPLQFAFALASVVQERLQIAAQFIFLLCVLLNLRAIAIVVTVLPNAVTKPFCETAPSNVFQTIEFIFRYGTCGDFCFSGHTTTSLLTFLFVRRFAYDKSHVQLALLFLMVLFLLLLRWHYTLDCFIAILLCTTMFEFYFTQRDEQIFYFNAFSQKRRKRILSEDDGIYGDNL